MTLVAPHDLPAPGLLLVLNGCSSAGKTSLARAQHHAIHAGRAYDFAVDTSGRSPAACASALVGWLRTRPRPQAIAAMQGARDAA